MINFFRKTRKKLADDNKFFKYSRYAIGEIVLVVIGILIALQINNWNENQKIIKLEKKLLSEVKIGLESDFKLISTCISNHQRNINSQDIIIDWIDEKYEYNDSLSRHFKYTFFATLFLPRDAPFESLKQFGMRNLTNKQLSDQISYLYDQEYEKIIYWQNENKKVGIDFRNTMDDIGFEFIKESDDFHLQPIDPLTLQTNKAYLFNLEVARGTLDLFTNNLLVPAKKEMEKTIKMIEQGLIKG